MIIRHFIFLALLTGLGLAGCHSRPSAPVTPSATTATGQKKSPGKIEFTKEMHNFGTLKEGEVVAFSFQFKNSGETPFRLTKVEPTCGCLSVRFDKAEISQQDLSAIEVIFNTEGEWGNQIKTVDVVTSAGETRTLTIGAFVENKDFNPDINN